MYYTKLCRAKFASKNKVSLLHNEKENFHKFFTEKFPLEFNYENIATSTENLTCFIAIQNLISKTRIMSLTKYFVDYLIKITNNPNDNNSKNSLYDICDEILADKILNQIEEIHKNRPSYMKLKISQPKLNNAKVNVYNIRNYILEGIPAERKIKKD